MQYVDSKGCAFIRVRFSGPARWVPRVTRQRRQMCGLSPTVISNTPTKVARAQPESNSIPVEITFDDPIVTASSVASPAKPQRGEVASFGGALTRMFRSKPAPKPIARVNATPMRTTVTDPILRQPTTKVIRPGGGELKVPAGYKIAWNDDRLNPNRGVQKVSGMIQTTKHWTNTVPRKHRNVASEQERKAWSNLVYPFQERADLLNYVNAMGDLELDVKSTGAIEMSPTGTGQLSARISTRSIAPSVAETMKLTGRYIQVGAFGRRSNAEGAQARLRQAGLPVDQRVIDRNGAKLTLVMAGPFSDIGALRDALAAAHGIGFTDAFVK